MNIIKNLCLGLKEIQNKKLIHRDLKPDNIFLTKDNIPKIGDFGISKQLSTMKEFAKTAIGTLIYMAPEFLSGNYNYKVDNWSLGCIIHELCALDTSFFSNNMADFVNINKKLNNKRINTIFYGNLLQEIIDCLLIKDYKKRAEIDYVLQKIGQEQIKIGHPIEINIENSVNEINCTYYSNEKKDIYLIENYEKNNDDSDDISLNDFIQDKNENKHLLDKDIIEIYVNGNKISNNIYNINKSEEIKVKFKFKKLLNSTSYLFKNCYCLKTIDLSSFNSKNITSMIQMFYNCRSLESVNLKNLDTKNVIKMRSMFMHCSSLKSIDLSKLNTENVNSMREMFCGCLNLKSINLPSSTYNLQNVRHMFSGCNSLKDLDLSKFHTKNIYSMDYMFSYCKSLISLNLSSFNTSNVKSMSSMFECCYNLKSINLKSFDTNYVSDMSKMFENCMNLEYLDLSSFKNKNTSNVSYMFSGCTNLKKVTFLTFDSDSMNNMSFMFSNCLHLEEVKLNFSKSNKVSNMSGMFKHCHSLKIISLKSIYPNFDIKTEDMLCGCFDLEKIKLEQRMINVIIKDLKNDFKYLSIFN